MDYFIKIIAFLNNYSYSANERDLKSDKNYSNVMSFKLLL